MAVQPPTIVTNLATTVCTPSESLSSIARVLALFLYSLEAKLAFLRPDNTRRPPWHRLVTQRQGQRRSVASGGDYVIHRWPLPWNQFPSWNAEQWAGLSGVTIYSNTSVITALVFQLILSLT